MDGSSQVETLIELPPLERYVEPLLSNLADGAPENIPLLSLADTPLLVLTGPPGSGKTWALRALVNAASDAVPFELTQRTIPTHGDDDPSRLLIAVSDGVDERRDGVQPVRAAIDELARITPPGRLRVWLSCRPGTALNDLVRVLEGNPLGAPRICELSPLREADIQTAFAAPGGEVAETLLHFWQNVRHWTVEPFIRWPLILRLLFAVWRHGSLHGVPRVAIMRSAARILAERGQGGLDVERRLAVAGWMAAVDLLCGPKERLLDPGPVVMPAVAQAQRPELVRASMIEEVRRTALFTHGSAGPVWWHRDLEEHLGADWLIKRLTPEQIDSLLRHPTDPQGGVAPHLQGLAGWIAALDEDGEIRRRIRRLDIESWLLGADAASPSERAEGVADLLRAQRDERFVFSLQRSFAPLSNLKHPELSAQLVEVLKDRRERADVRELAAYIAWACQLRELVPALLDLVEDRDDPQEVRVCAAYSAFVCGKGAPMDPDIAHRWRRLLESDKNDDPDDELLGNALQALWDAERLGADELFAALRPRRQESFSGAYIQFLRRKELLVQVRERSGRGGVLAGLRWIASKSRRELEMPDGAELVDGLLREGWEAIGAPEVHAAIRALVERFAGDVLPDRLIRWHATVSDRHAVLIAIVGWIAEGLTSHWAFISIARPDEIPWMLDRAKVEHDSARINAWVRLVQAAATWDRAEVWLDAVLAALEEDSARFSGLQEILAVDLNAPWLVTRRAMAKRQLDDEPARSTGPSVEEYLSRASAADGFTRWHLYIAAIFHGSHYGSNASIGDSDFWRSSVSSAPGWQALDQVQQGDAVLAAAQWLESPSVTVNALDWIAKQEWPVTCPLGIGALELVLMRGDDSTLSPTTWSRWAPAVIAAIGLRESVPECEHQLRAAVCARAPDAVLSAARATVFAMKPGVVESTFDALEALPLGHWPDHFREWLGEPTLPVRAAEELFRRLVRRDDAATLKFAADLIAGRAAHASLSPVSVAVVLLRETHGRAWSMVLQQMSEDLDFRVALIDQLASVRFAYAWPSLEALAESELESLVTWLFERFPPSGDPEIAGTHWVGPREQAALARGDALSHLVQRGTWQTVRAVSALHRRFPRFVGPWTLDEARRNARGKTLRPFTANDLLSLAAGHHRRLVRTEAQLVEAIELSVARWRERVIQEPLRIWERLAQSGFQPMEVAAIESQLREHLRADLPSVVVGPIPKPRPLPDGCVIAMDLGEDRPVEVRLIVVPPWHENLEVRLQDVDGPALIVVPWFEGDAWLADKNSARWGAVARRQRGEVERILAEQARNKHGEYGSSLRVVVPSLRFNERLEHMVTALPAGALVAARLREAGINVRRVNSLGDVGHWHLRLETPERWRERFGLQPHFLLSVSRAPLVTARLDALRRALDQGDVDLDRDFSILCSDAADVERRAEALGGQSLAWPNRDGALASLDELLSRGLRANDVFDEHRAVAGQHLFGREAEIADLRRDMLQGKSVFVSGLRKVGKTSLLKAALIGVDPLYEGAAGARIAEGATALAWAIYLDIEGLTEQTEEALCDALVSRLWARMELDGLPPPIEDVLSPQARLSQALRTAITRHEHSVVIALDECDWLVNCGADGQEMRGVARFLGLLRGLSQELGRLSTVFLARDPRLLTRPKLEGVTNPWMAWPVERPLGPLGEPQSRELLKRLGRRVGLPWADALLQDALLWTGGHPMLLRQYGSAWFKVAREQREGVPLDREAITDEFLARDAPATIVDEVLVLLREQYPEAHRLLLQMAAEDAYVTTTPRPEPQRTKALIQLKRFGLLRPSGSSSGVWRVIAHFAAWTDAPDQPWVEAAK